MKAAIGAVRGQQIFVPPLLDHATAIDHDDPVGVTYRRQPVGDD